MAFDSLQSIIAISQSEQISFAEVILNDDMQERKVTKEESLEQMNSIWEAILEASAMYDKNLKSSSGLVGGDGAKMEEYRTNGFPPALCDSFVTKVIARALEMGESNACMKRIVAAPTAGSCGVLPAVLVTYYNEKKCSTKEILLSLYVAAGIGQVIAVRASISGAEGGCQAEIGSASAMAAGALIYLQGGDGTQIVNGVAMALKNLLGLVCDPVAGLVEVPCVKRNVMGAVNALTTADMAMAGIISQIPPDEVLDAMKEIGDKMDHSLKETGKGGLAATPKAIEIASRIFPNSL